MYSRGLFIKAQKSLSRVTLHTEYLEMAKFLAFAAVIVRAYVIADDL